MVEDAAVKFAVWELPVSLIQYSTWGREKSVSRITLRVSYIHLLLDWIPSKHMTDVRQSLRTASERRAAVTAASLISCGRCRPESSPTRQLQPISWPSENISCLTAVHARVTREQHSFCFVMRSYGFIGVSTATSSPESSGHSK